MARIATGAHGVVTRTELARAGITAEEINGRLRTGGLIPVHRGVYRVGHMAPSIEATYLAAVLACGRERSSVDALPATERRVPGVRTRRSRGIGREDATTWRGVPVTTPARTLVDVAADLGVGKLARACHEAGVRYRTTRRT